ncbi:MAG: T9SS type A sorting domain-containing protein [Flavobacteriales bacterium]|nr:T9SS type A sorting domain-containing protein [Flavobacteriales bacterium]
MFNTIRFHAPTAAIICCTVLLTITHEAHAQPQWRFHLAFEDGTGARDTIWFIFDETATLGLDEALGEGAISMDPTVFNVWVRNADWDSTKTRAWPFSYFPNIEAAVMGSNYEYPVTLSWDTALFQYTAEGLPWPGYIPGAQLYCDYIFFTYEDQLFDMFSDNSIVIEAPILFETLVRLGTFLPLGLNETTGSGITLSLVDDRLSIAMGSPPSVVHIHDIQGRVVFQVSDPGSTLSIETSLWPSGVYLVQALFSDGQAMKRKWTLVK